MTAPSMTSETLRIIREPLCISGLAHHGPRIYCCPVFPKLDIENGLCRAYGNSGRRFGRSVTHHRDWLSSQDELPDIHISPIHAGKNNIITLSCVDDQELSISPVGTGIGNPNRRRAKR